MKYRAVLAAMACLLVACDQPMPTEPTRLTVAGPSFASLHTNTIALIVIDRETGDGVRGECFLVTFPSGNSTFADTNNGGRTHITVAPTETSGTIFCSTGAGQGSSGLFAIEDGVTHVTVFV